MTDRGAVAIRDANRLASGATSGCADRIIAVAGGEVEVLLYRADDWMVVPGEEPPASAGDGGCMAEDSLGVHNKARFVEAGGCMTDGATYIVGDATTEVG